MADGRANVGCGASVESIRKHRLDLRALLHSFLDLPEIKVRLSGSATVTGVRAWPLVAGSQTNYRRVFPGALLVGDAGAFVSPLEGEGIYYALHSGKVAAETIHRVLKEGDGSCCDLQDYERWFRRGIWPRFRMSYMLQRTVLAHPSVLDAAVWLANRSRAVARHAMVCGDYL
jgi:flavin-dependent dehydrogenase